MIEQRTDEHSCTWVLYPNRSMSWRQNCALLAALAAVTLLIALLWSLTGAWVILPFAGLEILSLGACLYYVCWKLNYRQVIRLNADELTVEQGHYHPRQRWQMDHRAAALAVAPAVHPWDTMTIILFDRHQYVCLGPFLNQEDRLALLASLQTQGLPVRSQALPEHIGF